MNIFINRKSKIKKFFILFYAVFVIFSSVFIKYSVNVYAASDADSSVDDRNFARMVLTRDLGFGYRVIPHDVDLQDFLDGYSFGIGGRWQRYCVEELGANEDDIKKFTPIYQYTIDNPLLYTGEIIINGIAYSYDTLINGFCKWDAENFKLENKETKDFEDLSDDDLFAIAGAFLNGLPYYIMPTNETIYDTKVRKYDFGNYDKGKLLKIVCGFDGDTQAQSNPWSSAFSDFRNKTTQKRVKGLYFCFEHGTMYCDNGYFFYLNTHEFGFAFDRGKLLGDVNTDDVKDYKTVYASKESIDKGGFQNNANVTNNCVTKNEVINNAFNTENYHEGDTIRNTDNLYGDEFSLNYNRINDLYYIPIKVDTSNLTEEQKKNCPCEIVSLPQGDFLMLPITQDAYHMPDFNILKQLTDNNYCTQQDFTNQFRSIMNYTVINKDGDVYNYNNETVSKDTYYNEVNEYNKNNYIPNGTNITKIFPFCLPFDISRLLTPFNAEPVTPKFVVNFASFNSNIKFNDASSGSADVSSGSSGGGSMDINFDTLKIDELAKLLRTGEIILFTISLAIWFFRTVSK